MYGDVLVAVGPAITEGLLEPSARRAMRPALAHAETERILIEYCRERLIKWSCPRQIEFCKEMPKTRIGKVDYRLLVDTLIEKTLQTQVHARQRLELQTRRG